MRNGIMFAASVAALLVASSAMAQELQSTTTTTTTETSTPVQPRAERREETRVREGVLELQEGSLTPSYATGVGVSLMLGGGPTGFLEADARRLTSSGGGWDARLTVGTRSILGVELGYIGAAQTLSAPGLDASGYLLKNGAEAVAHLTILNGPVQPYVLAGAGWTNFTIQNAAFNDSPLPNKDNMAHFPVGAGVGVHLRGLVIDGRGVIRPVAGDNMLNSSGGRMHTWEGKVMAGWEF